HEEFNAAKTWTEYFNRLAGATAGVFLLLTAIFSFTYMRTRKRIVVLSVFNLFLVYFQAWMGSIVVSTNLMPWVITVVMSLPLVLVGIIIYTFFQGRVFREKIIVFNKASMGSKMSGAIMVLLTLIQTVVGTDIREEIDLISSELRGQGRDTSISR